MPELVLYGIRLLAKQFLGTVLDIEVDQSFYIFPQYLGPAGELYDIPRPELTDRSQTGPGIQ